jgi:RNA polymerase sigma-70 factor (ECF subfamily)
MEDDLSLWNKIRVNGDVQALKVLHDRYYNQLYLYTRKIFNNSDGWDEAVSDCFIKLWTKRHDILIDRSVSNYLFLMLRNGLIDNLRKKKGIVFSEVNSLPEIPDEGFENDTDHLTQLYVAMDKLPVQRRRILELAVYESATYNQIAEKLNISVNTVKTQIGRAYRFLKEELDPKSFQLLFMLKTNLANLSE